MIAPLLLVIVAGYGFVAARAFRHGGVRRLWLTCAAALAASVLFGVSIAVVYNAPNPHRVGSYFLALVGPAFIMTAAFLTALRARVVSSRNALAAAYVGSLVGTAIGFILVVYGLPEIIR